MASHGKRYASARTKQMKAYKKLQKRANRRLRKLNKSKYGGRKNPAIANYTNDEGVFTKATGLSSNELRKNYAKMNRFLHSETGSVKGAKRVLRQTVGNIFAGHGQTTEQDIQAMNNIEIFYNDPEKGATLITKYFDVFYKVKDKLSSMHIGNISSDEIMNAIKEVISTDKIIKSTSKELSTQSLADGSSETVLRIYENLLDSADLIEKVVDELD